MNNLCLSAVFFYRLYMIFNGLPCSTYSEANNIRFFDT